MDKELEDLLDLLNDFTFDEVLEMVDMDAEEALTVLYMGGYIIPPPFIERDD